MMDPVQIESFDFFLISHKFYLIKEIFQNSFNRGHSDPIIKLFGKFLRWRPPYQYFLVFHKRCAIALCLFEVQGDTLGCPDFHEIFGPFSSQFQLFSRNFKWQKIRIIDGIIIIRLAKACKNLK